MKNLQDMLLSDVVRMLYQNATYVLSVNTDTWGFSDHRRIGMINDLMTHEKPFEYASIGCRTLRPGDK